MQRAVLACAVAACGVAPSAAQGVPDPRAVLRRAVLRYMQTPPGKTPLLRLPDYGPSIALSAMYDTATLLGDPAVAAFVDAYLDEYAADPSSVAGLVLANRTVPWGYSIGDLCGLMPIAYLSHADYHGLAPGAGRDWDLVLRVLDKYVLGWPLRLPDAARTISRNASAGTWGNETAVNASILWSDDQFMGIALASRVVRHPGTPRARALALADWIAAQQLSFASYMQDAASGLYRHGFNHADGHLSCCNWGRANGWVMLAHAEVVSAVAAVAPAHPSLPALVRVWQRHAAGLAALQAPGDGRWHEVLDERGTYLETSVTAMALYSLVTGALGGWLDAASLGGTIEAAWAGLAAQVASDGTVAGICEGTPIGADVAFYEARTTYYNGSSSGIGSVFRACVAFDAWARRG